MLCGDPWILRTVSRNRRNFDPWSGLVKKSANMSSVGQ